jgi:hypothetical protein
MEGKVKGTAKVKMKRNSGAKRETDDKGQAFRI